jgi:hypothetical protein
MDDRLFAVPKLILFLDNRGPVAGLSLLRHGPIVLVMLTCGYTNTAWPDANTDVVGKRRRCNGANHRRNENVRSHFAFLLLLSEQNAVGQGAFQVPPRAGGQQIFCDQLETISNRSFLADVLLKLH